jgi:hypothetical protein
MEKKPQLNPEDVMAFVGNAHGDFGKVKALLEKEPALINAAWDWGGGDWETALGAAAHTGQREIAEYLLARGARIDVFAAAMLGKLSLVQAILTEFPEMKHAPGPHGIPLLVHAKMGGEAAKEVQEFLERG